MTDDALSADIERMVAALVRAKLREEGETETLERFRDRSAWTVAHEGRYFVVTWSEDGEPLALLDADTVAMAVALWRAWQASQDERN